MPRKETHIEFFITKSGGMYLKELNGTLSIWCNEVEEAKVFQTYIEAETTIDHIDIDDYLQVQKVFRRK